MSKEEYAEIVMQCESIPAIVFYLDQYASKRTAPLLEALKQISNISYFGDATIVMMKNIAKSAISKHNNHE